MPRQHTTNDKAYARARREVLQDATCHWCGGPATEADHLVPYDIGGDNESLVASCKPCNSRRGAQYVNQKNKQRIDARRKINTKQPTTETNSSDQNVFLLANDSPRAPRFPLSESVELGGGLGQDLPRLETVLPDAAGSYGPLVVEWAKDHLGIELFPWQCRTLFAQLLHDENGDLLHRISLTSTARQQGKSMATQALVGWWLTGFSKIRGEKQSILSTSNRLDLAVNLFDALADIMEERFGAKIGRAYGRNYVQMTDEYFGSKWIIRAAKPSVGHGTSNDLIIADEIWDMSPAAIDGGLLPSMRARRSPLLSCWSTSGTEQSVSMLRFREQGLRAIDKGEATSFHMAEWSPSPDMDPMSPSSWGYGNPSLGRTITVETLLAESQSPDRAQFLRASCNLWVSSDKGWIAPGLWPSLKCDDPIPEGGVVAIESSIDSARYYGLRVVQLLDQRAVATVEFVVESFAALLMEVERLAANPGISFLISPSIDIHWPVRYEKRRVIVGYLEIQKYTATARNMIHEKMLLHDGSTQLAEHVARAVAVKTQGSIALSSQRSSGPIELARLLVWAAAYGAKPKDRGKPMIAFSNR